MYLIVLIVVFWVNMQNQGSVFRHLTISIYTLLLYLLYNVLLSYSPGIKTSLECNRKQKFGSGSDHILKDNLPTVFSSTKTRVGSLEMAGRAVS